MAMDDRNPRVSVIVATHNNEEHLGECLDSILCGQMDEIEVIVVDVNSTDGTKDIIRETADFDDRVKFLADSMESIGHAKNMAIDRARAPYILIVEPGDYIKRNMLEYLFVEFETMPEVGMRLFETECFGDDTAGRTNRDRIDQKSRANKEDDRRIEKDSRQFRWFVFECNAMYRKSFLYENHIRHYEEPGTGKQDIAFRFYAMSRLNFSMTMDILYYRRLDRIRKPLRDAVTAYDMPNELRFLKERLQEDPKKWWEMRLYFWQTYYDANLLHYERLSDDLKPSLSKRMQADIKGAIRSGEYSRDHFDIKVRKEMELLLRSVSEFDIYQKSVERKRNESWQENLAKQERKHEIISGFEEDENRWHEKMESAYIEEKHLNRRKLVREMTRDLTPLRLLLGMTANEMGDLIGISETVYKSLESGKREVSWDQYMALLFVFRFNPKTEGVTDALGLYPKPLQILNREGVRASYA